MVMNPRTHPRGMRPDFTLPKPNPNPKPPPPRPNQVRPGNASPILAPPDATGHQESAKILGGSTPVSSSSSTTKPPLNPWRLVAPSWRLVATDRKIAQAGKRGSPRGPSDDHRRSGDHPLT